MSRASNLSNSALLARLSHLVQAERKAAAHVITYLIEVDRRRLFLEQACSSLYTFCIERLGYSEDAALKRVRVARLAERLPRVLEELRSGAVHLTGLFLLSQHLTEDNADALLAEARHKSRRELERVIARWFPRPAVPDRLLPTQVGAAADPNEPTAPPLEASTPDGQGTCPGTGRPPSPFRLEPLSITSYRVEFTASTELHDKIQRAKELVSHSVPSGELAAVFERALDALIRAETKRRLGAGPPRKQRMTRTGSRHVPVAVARRVWERDGSQCTFRDAEGRRCTERRFLTIEHEQPFALGGPPTVENLCLLCAAHNQHTARQVFGENGTGTRKRGIGGGARESGDRVTARQGAQRLPRTGVDAIRSSGSRELDDRRKVLSALCHLGFRRREAASAVESAAATSVGPGLEPLLRASLELLSVR